MPSRSAVRVAVASLVAAAVVAGGTVGAGAVEAPSTGSIAVHPVTGLVDGQVVEVSGAGFAGGDDRMLILWVCRAAPTDNDDCGLPGTPVVPDESGSFTVDMQVLRLFPGVDCTVVECVIALTEGPTIVEVDSVSLVFAPVPEVRIEVAPDSDLAAEDVVRVVGSGFVAGRDVGFRQCRAGVPTGWPDCTGWTSAGAADGTGQVGPVDVPVTRFGFPYRGAPVDCAIEACELRADVEPGHPEASAPLAFRYVPTELGVALPSAGTLRVGTNDAVVEVAVSCPTTTAVSVEASISQGAVRADGGREHLRCEPDAPARVFVRPAEGDVVGGDLAPGPGTLAVAAWPSASPDVPGRPDERVGAVGPVELHDHDAVVATVQERMAEPDADELRDEVLRAVLSRAQQDPAFRAEWRALTWGPPGPLPRNWWWLSGNP
jgi:hypothetical protein